MKKISKNETEILDIINRIQSQLFVLDQKINTLLNRSPAEAKLTPKPAVNTSPLAAPKPNDRNNPRQMFKAICADCKKECSIPFKPSGDRPVYCQDCFSRRRVISMSGMKVDVNPPVNVQETKAKEKKKAVTAKKPIAKKKSAPKKK